MTALRLGIIGATGTALKRTLPALSGSLKVVVSAVQARNAAKLNAIREQLGAALVFEREQDLFDSGVFDFLYIATPPFLHRRHISQAMATGKPMVCEKPLGQNLEEAMAVAALLQDYGQPFMVAHHLRHQQAMADIKTFLNEGRMGTPASGWAQWNFKLNRASQNAIWKLDESLGGAGPFADAGAHLIDILLYLFGAPRSVCAHEHSADAMGRMNGSTGLLCYDAFAIAVNASQEAPSLGNDLLLYGTEGKVEAFGSMSEKSIRAVTLTTSGGKSNHYAYPEVNLYGAEIEDFADFIAGRAPSHRGTSLDEACLGVRVMDALHRAATSGRRVEV
ncbi:MAG TPA: Gfo/Idh/MocA family oxidoreductase [Terriglobales bacterium]|nr:Gfo/Idh/MocA family oxidoreductase [Terriglobales bacterium]